MQSLFTRLGGVRACDEYPASMSGSICSSRCMNRANLAMKPVSLPILSGGPWHCAGVFFLLHCKEGICVCICATNRRRRT